MEAKFVIFVIFMVAAFGMLLLAISIPKNIIYAPFKVLFILIAGVLDILALSSRYYTYLIVPVFQQRKRDIVLSNEEAYHLSPSGDTILRKEGSTYIATAYVLIPLYVSASAMAPDEKINFATQVSRLTTIIKSPVRFTTEMRVMNKDDYIATLRTAVSQTSEEQTKLMQQNSDPKLIGRARGEFTMWKNMLDAVSSAPSFELVTYASIAAMGYKEYEASAAVQQKISELVAGISSVMGITPSIVTGEELLKFIEPEYLIPYSTISQQINENLVKEGGF